jgi:ParB family chromosome partitioning protein
MAREAETVLDGSGWLAEPLRTPAPLEPDAPDAPAMANEDAALLAADPAEPDADAPFAIAAE